MKNLILIMLFSLTLISIKAQDIKVIGATQPSWAGGACCSHGTNYYFSFESTDTLQIIPQYYYRMLTIRAKL